MNKLCTILISLFIVSCNNADNKSTTGNGTDTVGLTNPVSIDTIKHPSGVDNSSVISTDTAAMNVQNTIRISDSLKHLKAKDSL